MSFNPIIVRFKLKVYRHIDNDIYSFNPIIVRFKPYTHSGSFIGSNSFNPIIVRFKLRTFARLRVAKLSFNPIIVRFKLSVYLSCYELYELCLSVSSERGMWLKVNMNRIGIVSRILERSKLYQFRN